MIVGMGIQVVMMRVIILNVIIVIVIVVIMLISTGKIVQGVTMTVK